MPDLVPVEEVRPGRLVVLPQGRRVKVERVDLYPDDTFVVRWRRPNGDHPDRVQLGSLYPRPAGETVQVGR